MITHTLVMLCLALPPLLIFAAAKAKPAIHKNDNDTANARYAINEHGILEEISKNKMQGLG